MDHKLEPPDRPDQWAQDHPGPPLDPGPAGPGARGLKKKPTHGRMLIIKKEMQEGSKPNRKAETETETFVTEPIKQKPETGKTGKR